MRAILVLVCLSAVALWWGGQHLYVGLRDREPLEITCADYVKQHPDTHWLKLTRCDADVDNLAYEDDRHGGADKVYVPVRPLGEDKGATHIVVERDDSDIRELVALGNAAGEKNPVVQRVAKSFDEPVEGVVKFGIDLSDKDRNQLKGLGLGLADDFVIIERGSTPKLALGALVFALGLLGPGFVVFRLVRKRRA
jgi:hypothetical protein